jgi:hypothetical protein
MLRLLLSKKGGAMKKYTLQPIRPETASSFPTRYRLYAGGEPTVIAISDEEAVLLQQNGPNIERRALETFFKCSPTRKEKLASVPR